MFWRWVKIIKIKKMNKITLIFWSKILSGEIIFKALSFMKETTKTVKDENIEDTDEYLKINEITNQENINKKLSWTDSAKRIPKYVATPFPPLNFNHTGKICPKNTIKHDNWINSGKFWAVNITGIYPFKTSNKRVNAASDFLPVLRTLVAPIFPEPIFLISTLPKNLDINKPNGIEPLK